VSWRGKRALLLLLLMLMLMLVALPITHVHHDVTIVIIKHNIMMRCSLGV